jgi:polar amino acid transport system substrate-binding protein
MRRRTLLAGAGAAGVLELSSQRAARADAMADAKKRGTLMIGTEAAYVPYEFFKDGAIVGYDPDIMALIGPKLGVKVQFIDTAWSGIIPALYAGKFDCIVSAMTITAPRAEKVLFSMPYADASNVILLRADETRIKTADDLSGKIVGVQLGSAAAGIIKTFEAKLKQEGKPGYASVKEYEHYPEAYQDLINERVDAVVNSKSTMMVVMRDAPGKFKMIGGVSDITAYFGMAFRKEDGALRDFVNTQLAEMKKDGTLARLQTKWFGATMETPNTVPAVLPS